MNWIEKMIVEQCPNGVKKAKLGDAGDFYNGVTGKNKNDFVGGNATFITYMNVYNNPSLKTEVEDKVVIAEGEKQNTIEYGDCLFTTSSETPEECGMSSVLTHKPKTKLYLNSFCFGYRFNDLSSICPAFYSHLFRSNALRLAISKTANGVTRFNVSKKLFGKISIPLPPLSIQEEIVSVLDKFSELIEKTDEEIALRQKQYEYYREKLLTFEDGEVEWKKIVDIVANDCTISYGIVQPGEGVDFGVPVVRPVDMVGPITYNKNLKNTTQEISNSYKKTLLKGGELLICVRGTTGIISIAADDLKGCNVTRGIVPLWFKQEYNKKYIYYVSLSTKIQDDIESYTNGAGLRQINIKDLKQIKLPIPSLSRQQEIVETLDKFEALISKLKEERELRQKQYEYYREKLLTF